MRCKERFNIMYNQNLSQPNSIQDIHDLTGIDIDILEKVKDRGYKWAMEEGFFKRANSIGIGRLYSFCINFKRGHSSDDDCDLYTEMKARLKSRDRSND